MASKTVRSEKMRSPVHAMTTQNLHVRLEVALHLPGSATESQIAQMEVMKKDVLRKVRV